MIISIASAYARIAPPFLQGGGGGGGGGGEGEKKGGGGGGGGGGRLGFQWKTKGGGRYIFWRAL